MSLEVINIIFFINFYSFWYKDWSESEISIGIDYSESDMSIEKDKDAYGMSSKFKLWSKDVSIGLRHSKFYSKFS